MPIKKQQFTELTISSNKIYQNVELYKLVLMIDIMQKSKYEFQKGIES